MALHPNPLSKVFLTGVIESRPDHQAWRAYYKGLSLFTPDEVAGYKLAWDVVMSENNLAGIYAINGRPIPGSEMLFAERFQEVKNVMSSRVIHPSDVMILREPGTPAVGTQSWNMKAEAQKKLVKNVNACDDEVDAQVEYLCMGALQGQIVWPPVAADGTAIAVPMPQWGNVQLTINFPIRTVFNQDATTLVGYSARNGTQVLWTDYVNSDPLFDLEVISELISETLGIDAHGSRILMGHSLLSHLCFNESIISWIKGTEAGVKMVDVSELQNFVQTRLGYTIEEYNARWTYRTGSDAQAGPTVNSVPFMNGMRMIIIPPNTDLGYYAMAPSPDGLYKPGKYNWMAQDQEPPWETRVGEGLVGFPVFQRADQVFIFDANS